MTPASELPPIFPGAAFDVVAVAASAGGLHALSVILDQMPPEFPAAITVVQHLDPRHPSLLAEILSRRTRLLVKQATAGEYLQAGRVYIAPPDRHLLVNADLSLTLAETALVHFVRPSADLLFESVAAACRTRALAVVMTGTGTDGNMGVRAIKKVGGTVIVEDPSSAEFAGMPEAAVRTGSADLILPLQEIGPTILQLVLQSSLNG